MLPEDNNNQPEDQPDTTQPTPPAPSPSDNQPQPGVDPSILQAYAEQLRAEAQERARLQRELDAERNKKSAPAPITPEQEKEFFDKPITTTRDLIQKEIQAAIQPLNQYAAQQARTNAIEVFKQQMRNNPAAFPYIGIIEQQFDNIISQTANIDANSVIAAYNLALGNHISSGGRLEQPKPADAPPTPTRGNQPVPVPAHVRPTPPAPPMPAAKKLRPLSEAEKKIARYNNMSDAEYLLWSEGVDSTEVAHITDEEIARRAK